MDILKLKLKDVAAKGKLTEKEKLKQKKEEDIHAENLFTGWKGLKDQYQDPSLKTIPKFYVKPPDEDNALQQKLREEARAVFLQRRSEELLDNDELKALYVVLDEQQTLPTHDGHSMLGWDDFCAAASRATSKCRRYFTPIVFAKLLEEDRYGRIRLMCFFNYVMRKVWLHQTRIGLSLYDVSGEGYLREMDLENYILEMIHTLPQLKGLEKSFRKFYVCMAVRKFFFFIDPLRTGKIKIQDVLACGFLDELLELRDSELSRDAQDSNWFSAPSALRVYGQYLNLDKDHNGMLSKEELARYGTGKLTSVFMDQVFQVCRTYDGQMDYKTYLDFVLALENRREPQALQYLFRILDIRHQGWLDVFTLNFFFRAIQDQLRAHGQELVLLDDIKDEVFDMVKPADPSRITLQDLIDCGQGDTVVSILIDLDGFWTHENREVLGAEATEDSGAVLL